ITEFAFQPKALKMEAGDKVRFVNLDNAPHTATANNGAFGTGRLNRGDEATVVIEQPGTYTFFCEFHRGMRGEIIAS
ncbi:MAG: cupredoxin domain-containing protein, partial [Pseudomonadota bacterium]